MKYYEKLLNLLCEVPEINDDIKKLKFGTFVELIFEGTEDDENGFGTKTLRYQESNSRQIDNEIKNPSSNNRGIKIWNPLEEKHLRLYCFKKGYNCSFMNNNLILIEKFGLDQNDNSSEGKLIQYTSFESLEYQKEDFYQKIYEFLKDNT